jgi:Rap1a immunity proteins
VMLGFSFCDDRPLSRMGNTAMRLLISLITLLLVSIGQAHGQQDDGSANYVLPLCKTWVKLATDTEVEEVGSIAKIESIRLTTSGMCAGVLVGISQTLRMFGLACPTNSVSNEQLVRMVVGEMEKHPEQMSEKFSVLASEAIMAAWPCKKYGDPTIVSACVIQPGPFSFCLP